MKLTTVQEEQLIEQYDRLLWSIVHRFKRRKNDGYQNKEDLHSECMLVFLKHIRSCDTMDDIRKIPIRDMINAMCLFVLGEQALSYPKRTSDFRQVMDSAASKVDYTELDREESLRQEPLNDALDEIAFKDFCATLSPLEREVVVKKLEGLKNREIARDLGVTDVVMTRTIQKMRKFYHLQAA